MVILKKLRDLLEDENTIPKEFYINEKDLEKW